LSQKIAYLGPSGTFTEEALRALCEHYVPKKQGEDLTYIPMKTIPDCLTACQNGSVDFAMVPVENTIEGSVSMTLDWLIHKVDIPILAELVLPIKQFAIVHPNHKDLPLSEFTKIISHSHAIAQCHQFISDHCAKSDVDYMKSTAEAVEWVRKNPEEKLLAIGPKLSSTINKMHIKAEGIEDYPNNFTRFVFVGKTPLEGLSEPEGENNPGKTTILVTLPEDFPGALHQVLSAFAWRKLNLSRIESRPTKKGLGSYFFFIDIEQKMDEVLLPSALSEIEALGCQVRFLGSYPCFLPKMMSKMPT
jgi:prephenate dehydratase